MSLVTWLVEYTDEFESEFWSRLNEAAQEDVAAAVRLLEEKGPSLPFPYSSGIASSRHSQMRELRIQHQGKPIRVFYAFNPLRAAILLIGGSKEGDDRCRMQTGYTTVTSTSYEKRV
jgi:hypothetical protein